MSWWVARTAAPAVSGVRPSSRGSSDRLGGKGLHAGIGGDPHRQAPLPEDLPPVDELATEILQERLHRPPHGGGGAAGAAARAPRRGEAPAPAPRGRRTGSTSAPGHAPPAGPRRGGRAAGPGGSGVPRTLAPDRPVLPLLTSGVGIGRRASSVRPVPDGEPAPARTLQGASRERGLQRFPSRRTETEPLPGSEHHGTLSPLRLRPPRRPRGDGGPLTARPRACADTTAASRNAPTA